MLGVASVAAIVAALVGALAPNQALGTIALAGAAVAGFGVVYGQVLRPTLRFAKRASRGVDLLLEMPERFAGIEEKLEAQEHRLVVIEHNAQPDVQAFVRDAIDGAGG